MAMISNEVSSRPHIVTHVCNHTQAHHVSDDDAEYIALQRCTRCLAFEYEMTMSVRTAVVALGDVVMTVTDDELRRKLALIHRSLEPITWRRRLSE